MILRALYQVSDSRPEGFAPGEATFWTIPGGLVVFDVSGDGRVLTWDDEDPQTFIDDEDAGTVLITTEDGVVLFERVH